ncbi:OFA family MFS transporter [Neorhizobium sp. NCHU2750]|uniref:OFA family MFS transporter n=1 Tax=Neorhizobium sp. NCHU2750 TaxID=1825976 RepID=UPI000E7487B6|nr:MFS transporter, OFA family, oxalate/formate antiporter [Neorhizobium sp. NCHU2750]
MSALSNSKRYYTLVGTILCQFALGSVYTWSLFNEGLSHKLSQPLSQVAFTFGLLSLGLAVASSLSGRMQEKFGLRAVAITAGLALGLGLYLTSTATNLTMLYIYGGILVGAADGTGYLLTLSNCVKWFPERKGLASAFSIGAYGLGSLGFKYLNLALLNRFGMESAFGIWAIVALVLIVGGAFLISEAPQPALGNARARAAAGDYTLAEAVRQPKYWMLALMFLTVCMSGLYLIGVAKDVGERYVGLSTSVAADTVAIVAAANLLGRLVLGVLSDKIPRIQILSIALACALAGMLLLLFVPLNEYSFYVAVACVAFSFGGTITVYPGLVSDFFGLTNLARNYGLIYLGFGIGSVIGSIVSSALGGFLPTFYLSLVLLVVSLLCSVSLWPSHSHGSKPVAAAH